MYKYIKHIGFQVLFVSNYLTPIYFMKGKSSTQGGAFFYVYLSRQNDRRMILNLKVLNHQLIANLP